LATRFGYRGLFNWLKKSDRSKNYKKEEEEESDFIIACAYLLKHFSWLPNLINRWWNMKLVFVPH